jgi:hypothetical protein
MIGLFFITRFMMDELFASQGFSELLLSFQEPIDNLGFLSHMCSEVK